MSRALIFVTTGTSFIQALKLAPDAAVSAQWPDFDPGDEQHWLKPEAQDYATWLGAGAGKGTDNAIAARLTARLTGAAKVTSLTAELASLRAILRSESSVLAESVATTVVFLASDSTASRNAAIWNATAAGSAWKGQLDCDVEVVDGLSIEDPIAFQQRGLPRLGEIIHDRVSCERRSGHDPQLIFNVTGGYKGTIPFISLIALALGAQIYYLFQRSFDLIRLPKLSLTLEPLGSVEPQLGEFFAKLIDLQRIGGDPGSA